MAPPDADFELHRLRAGVPLRVERAPGEWPLRWVLFDAERRVRGSGHAWPGQREPIVVEVRAPLPPTPALARERLAADGHRRVMALVLDCFDWRLLQYLRTRGELPIFDALLASGHRAVLESDPPLTAAAMESLVWPDRGVRPSFVGQLHRLGVELAGLASVGDNPFAFLSLVLPEGESLFETVGAGDRVAANMLFTHGMIDAGRHAEVVGPHGRRRTARAARAYRPVRPDEQARFPLLLSRPRARAHIEGIAAEFDAATRVAAEAEVDLLMLRIEPLDILTHALYGELSEGGQDDGASLLLEAYRYVDHRLAELDASLDADDVLVVMSDHGIRTPMQHADDAIFVAAGGGIEAGRAAGRPHLRGVSRALASLLGLATDWPDTGVASGVASWSPRPLHLAVSRAKGASAPH